MQARRPVVAVLALAVLWPAFRAGAQEAPRAGDSFYARSLHFTTRGFAHWYAKEQGGPELITGKPFRALGCGTCHVSSCDTCHLKEVDGKPAYSVEAARSEKACATCHEVPSGDQAKIDVHASAGLTCMGCHSSREIHGNGIAYATYAEPGAVEARCEKCHDGDQCKSFAIHRGQVDCSACHARPKTQCHNCHLDTKLREKKSVSVPLEDMQFLVNHEGRVTAGTFLSYTYGRKTMITFGRSFSHAVVRQGRACAECHDTKTVRDLSANAFRLMEWRDGAIRNVRGVIPVVDGVRWNAVFLDRRGGKWVPLERAAEPLIQYSALCTPLTRAQLERLAARR